MEKLHIYITTSKGQMLRIKPGHTTLYAWATTNLSEVITKFKELATPMLPTVAKVRELRDKERAFEKVRRKHATSGFPDQDELDTLVARLKADNDKLVQDTTYYFSVQDFVDILLEMRLPVGSNLNTLITLIVGDTPVGYLAAEPHRNKLKSIEHDEHNEGEHLQSKGNGEHAVNA